MRVVIIGAGSDRELQARLAGTAWTRCDSCYHCVEEPVRVAS